jgi:hypothetical protein
LFLINSAFLVTGGLSPLRGCMQVAFVPSDPQLATVNVTVVDVPFQLYTHSHRHAGLNDAFDTSVRLLLAAEGETAAAGGNATVPEAGRDPTGRKRDGLVGTDGDGDDVVLRVPHPCLHAGYDSLSELPRSPNAPTISYAAPLR